MLLCPNTVKAWDKAAQQEMAGLMPCMLCCEPMLTEFYNGGTQVKQALRQGYEDDVDPPLSALAQYIKDNLTNDGYKHMMAVGGSHRIAHSIWRAYMS